MPLFHGCGTLPHLSFLALYLTSGLSLPEQESGPKVGCNPCLRITTDGWKTTQMLVYHSSYSCNGTSSACRHANTTYQVCTEAGSIACHTPGRQTKWQLQLYGSDSGLGATTYNRLLRYTTVPSHSQDKPLTLCFDTCHATDQDPAGIYCGGVEWERTYCTARFYVGFHRATLNRGPARSGKWETNRQRWGNALGGKVIHGQTKPDCKHHHCTPLCLRITPNQAKSSWVPLGEGNYEAEVTMGIHVPGARDPTSQVRFLIRGDWEKPIEHLVHTTFWKEMGTDVEVPAVTKNLFVDLAERVALSLRVTNCYVCAGTQMGEQWPWEEREVDYVNISRSPNLTWTDQQRPTQWALQNSIIGSRCFIRPARQKYNISTGTLACEAGMVCNTTRKWMD